MDPGERGAAEDADSRQVWQGAVSEGVRDVVVQLSLRSDVAHHDGVVKGERPILVVQARLDELGEGHSRAVTPHHLNARI
eukprot:4148910-Pyramimonas_sp.AAC.1